jgi:DNA modification methylase
MIQQVSQKPELTFKYNKNMGRHGWLRLTPAYSVKIVQDILQRTGRVERVLDPFAGTATTGLTCAENGITCDLVDINPFLVWFGQTKLRNYSPKELQTILDLGKLVSQKTRLASANSNWLPPMNFIERWWSPDTLIALSQLLANIKLYFQADKTSCDLALVAFCRTLIECSNADFGHQSVSFKQPNHIPTLFQFDIAETVADKFYAALKEIVNNAYSMLTAQTNIFLGDARNIATVAPAKYDCIITSPPYPNRISYVRELRPYMYWLNFLQEARQAGDLDWEAIGGTWGVATSRLASWESAGITIKHQNYNQTLASISGKSLLLSNYVRKYFEDMFLHLSELRKVLLPNAKVFYIVGNSKFYDTIVPVEELFEAIFEQHNYHNINVTKIRKRNSKKELFEFIVEAQA